MEKGCNEPGARAKIGQYRWSAFLAQTAGPWNKWGAGCGFRIPRAGHPEGPGLL